MNTAFLFALLCGLFLLIRLDHHKNRTRRWAERGGAACLFSVGLVGSLVTLFQP